MSDDARLHQGAYVHALASRLLRPNDAKNKLGAGYKTKFLDGRVLSVSTKELKNRRYRYIQCIFIVGPDNKQCTLPLASVKCGPIEIPCRQPTHPGENPFHLLNKAFENACSPEATPEIQHSLLSNPSGSQQASQSHASSSPASTSVREKTGIINEIGVSLVTPRNLLGSFKSSGDSINVKGQTWKSGPVQKYINGNVKPVSCSLRGPDNTHILRGTAPSCMTAFDIFMWMFPIKHLALIVQETNIRLRLKNQSCTSSGEVLRFFGVLVLMTRCKFSDRRELWSEQEQSPILGQPRFGKIMPRSRFENLRSSIRFSKQTDSPEVYTEQNQWQLCEGFVETINEHRREHVVASQLLCVDESISRWYGIGGAWINAGSPQYVKLDRKPEHGMEIQDIACEESQIILGLKLVKSANETAREREEHFERTNHNHGTNILLNLSAPWEDKERILIADSYFSSIDAAEALLKNNLKFIGVVKTATSRFPVKYFGQLEMFGKGSFNYLSSTLIANGETKTVVAVCWLDRNRRYFVATTGRLDTTAAQERVRWRQHSDGACPVEVRVSMPELVKDYFSVAGIIDAHYRICQDSLDLEKAIEVKEWSFRINSTLLGMVMTDAFQLHTFEYYGRYSITANKFVTNLDTSWFHIHLIS